jgi:hypothetical protein
VSVLSGTGQCGAFRKRTLHAGEALRSEALS